MNKVVLILSISIFTSACQVIGPPKEIPNDMALVSNALFYNGPGSYQDSTYRFSVKKIDDNNGVGLFKSVTPITPGKHEFIYRCVRQPANGESYPESTQIVEAGKCYIPRYIKKNTYMGRACKQDAASKFTQYSSGCGVGGTTAFITGGCGVELREISCEAFKKLERANTINELKAIEKTHNE